MKLLVLILPVVVLLTSCIIPKSNHVVPKYYLLFSSLEDTNSSESIRQASFYVKEVRLAQYLQDNRLVYRPLAELIEFREHERWGEPLEVGICRVVAQNLSKLLETLDYGAYPHRKKFDTDYEIQITIDRFEKISKNEVRLKAFWEIATKDGKQYRHSYDETFPISGMTSMSEVRALSVAILGISKGIEKNIRNEL